MTLQQIATAYGLTRSAIEKWPLEKRQQAIADLKAGVQPHIAELIGKLSIACYRASCHTGNRYDLDFTAESKFFNVYEFTKFECKAFVDLSPVNTVNLAGALIKLEELIYG